MSTTFYTGLTGLMAANIGLQNTAHNVANMQNPGFKRSDLSYSTLGHSSRHEHLSSGVCIRGRTLNFSPGHYLETGNETDLAIVGSGFFIIRLKNNELVYTRDGEFCFEQGVLMDKHSGGLVQGYNAQGHLVSISQTGSKTQPGKATHYLDLAGECVLIEKKKDDPLLPPDPNPTAHKYEPLQFAIDTIFDDQGKAHSLSFELTPKPSITNQDFLEGLEWELTQVTYDKTELNVEPQTIRFSSQSEGSAEEGANSIHVKLNTNQWITLNWGNYRTDKDKSVRLSKQDVTHTSTAIQVYQQDGFAEGMQINSSFDENGQINYHYNNNQSLGGVTLALAQFDNAEHELQPLTGNLFRANHAQSQFIGRANHAGFGCIQSQKLESSNVDSTTEFANIVILQRLFQSCTQLIEIDKQMLEELSRR